LPLYVQKLVVRAYYRNHKISQVKKAVDETKKGKRRLEFLRMGLELHDTRRGVEIQGNLTVSPGQIAAQIEAGGASIVHMVHA